MMLRGTSLACVPFTLAACLSACDPPSIPVGLGESTAPLIWSQQQKLVVSDSQPDARFGYAVSLDGDTAIVGKPYDDDAGLGDAGSAYVFVRNGGVWAEQQKLIAPDAEAGDELGAAVDVSGDTAIVGARYDDHAGLGDGGSAYVFVRNGGAWTLEAKLVPPMLTLGDHCGSSVAVYGDLAAIGCPYAEIGMTSDAGAVRVFARSGGVWSLEQELAASDVQGDARFGTSVNLHDVTLIAGADHADVGIVADAGAAYVFFRTGNTWLEEKKLVAPPLAMMTGDGLGVSVAVDGDTAVVGAELADHAGGTDAGNAFAFVRTGGVWFFQQEITPMGATTSDECGGAVAVWGDIAAIGCELGDVVMNAGSVHTFERSGGTWYEMAPFAGADTGDTDRFGCSVALQGDTLLVGAQTDDPTNGPPACNLGGCAGSAYVFAGLLAQGKLCSAPSECASGFCVDGVCCEDACGGGAADDCQACSLAAGSTADDDGDCQDVTAGIECRPAAGTCDAAESCNGTSSICPPDLPAADGTACDDGDPCTGPDACASGSCAPGASGCGGAGGAGGGSAGQGGVGDGGATGAGGGGGEAGEGIGAAPGSSSSSATTGGGAGGGDPADPPERDGCGCGVAAPRANSVWAPVAFFIAIARRRRRTCEVGR